MHPSSSPRPLRLALVGTGEVARRNYAPFLAAQPDVALACTNRTPGKAQALAATHGAEFLPTLDAVADWQPTAVFVLTAETCRHEVAHALLDRGVKRLFFEKPLVAVAGQASVSEEDFARGRELLATAQRRGCETAMIFNYRFFAQCRTAHELVAARQWGRAIAVNAQVHFACWSHCIDLIRHFAGDVAEITALAGGEVRPSAVAPGTDVMAAFRTRDGAAGTILGTSGMNWAHPLFELTLTFEHGRVHLRDLDGTLEILDGRDDRHETIACTRHTSRWDNYDESFRQSLGAYLATLRAGRPPPISGRDGLRELQFEAALRRSARERRPVRLDEEFPLP